MTRAARDEKANPRVGPEVDFLLSSGFLAFGRHIGFLDGAAQVGVRPARVFGTSSGALVGALSCAGLSPGDILAEVRRVRPIDRMAWSWTPWSGLFSLQPLIDRLETLLPDQFADLSTPLAVGVRRADGRFHFVEDGPLAPAVAASCAIPVVFRPVSLRVDAQPERCADGGAVDRIGLSHWRARVQRSPEGVVHLVERSAGAVGSDDFAGVRVVRSGRSGAGFWSLGDIEGRVAEARRATVAGLTGG